MKDSEKPFYIFLLLFTLAYEATGGRNDPDGKTVNEEHTRKTNKKGFQNVLNFTGFQAVLSHSWIVQCPGIVR